MYRSRWLMLIALGLVCGLGVAAQQAGTPRNSKAFWKQLLTDLECASKVAAAIEDDKVSKWLAAAACGGNRITDARAAIPWSAKPDTGRAFRGRIVRIDYPYPSNNSPANVTVQRRRFLLFTTMRVFEVTWAAGWCTYPPTVGDRVAIGFDPAQEVVERGQQLGRIRAQWVQHNPADGCI